MYDSISTLLETIVIYVAQKVQSYQEKHYHNF